jgi:hypothetical protein
MVALNERARTVIWRLVDDKDGVTGLDIVFDKPNVGVSCSFGKSFSS